MPRLGDVGEHAWIAALLRRLPSAAPGAGVLVGPGDDAAAVRLGARPVLLTTDSLVEGVHFRRGWLAPAALGRRAFGASVSDVAAMGGAARFALLGIEAPSDLPRAYLDGVLRGFRAAAAGAGARLVGGNLARGRRLALTTMVVGTAPGRVVTRAGARPGDGLWVTGALGASGCAVRRLRAGRRAAWPAPPLRLRAGMGLARVAHAMIDLSDGLAQDLGHLCRASGVGAEVRLDALPIATACRRALGPRAARFAATAGEDYELLVAMPAAARARLRGLGCRLTRIGTVVAGGPRARFLDADGRPVALGAGGFDHFRGRR
jgi:thiamine-monophosphate kinase